MIGFIYYGGAGELLRTVDRSALSVVLASRPVSIDFGSGGGLAISGARDGIRVEATGDDIQVSARRERLVLICDP